MILATSHVSKAEAFALVKAAERKVERIIMTHVDFPATFLTIEEQKELVRQGAFMEHTYTTPATGKVAWDIVMEQIRAIGPQHIVIGTDLGQTTGVFPDEGLVLYGKRLLENGLPRRSEQSSSEPNLASRIRDAQEENDWKEVC